MPGSPHVTIHATGPARAIKLKWRTAAGEITSNFDGLASSSLPLWLKLVKSGNTITAYYSINGTTWTPVGTAKTLTGLGSNFLYGMAVTSNSATSGATATFEPNPSSTPPLPTPTNTFTPPPPAKRGLTWKDAALLAVALAAAVLTLLPIALEYFGASWNADRELPAMRRAARLDADADDEVAEPQEAAV